jgi:hypothetical protein
LVDAELTTDDPENLENLVFVLPTGEEEPYVEYKYDLRGQEREKLRCIHCHQPHLAGFVIRKGAHRFFVGHICGNHIYGEDFEQYTADYDAAINRQRTLRRRREIEKVTAPFRAWLEQVWQSNIFTLYESVPAQLQDRMSWVWDNATFMTYERDSLSVKMPPTLFMEETDPRSEFAKIISEMNVLAINLIAKDELEQKSVDNIKRQLEGLIRRIEKVFHELKEVEDFFQPAVLETICNFANDHDNPKKRRYTSGMLSLTCKRTRDTVTVQMPKKYCLPNRDGLETLKEALRVL